MVEKFKLKKIDQLIYPKMMSSEDGENINGPSLIKVPSWIKNSLGKYYLYFSHHNGSYIRMAFSNNIAGPYTIFEGGVMHLKDSPGTNHIASPDVHVDNIGKRIIMYYHSFYKDFQYTFSSISTNGLFFVSQKNKLGNYYFRVFKFNNEVYSISKGKNTYGMIYKYYNKSWNIISDKFILNLRHTAILVQKKTIFIFYSLIGDVQESIYCSRLNLNNFQLYNTYKIVVPTCIYEGNVYPKFKSKEGIELKFVNQVRDPAIFVERKKKYLLYSVSGEKGIALGELI